MPYKDPETRRAASTERSRRRRERNRPPGWVEDGTVKKKADLDMLVEWAEENSDDNLKAVLA